MTEEERRADRTGALVLGIALLGARRAVDGHGRAQVGERAEPVDELGLDANHAVRIALEQIHRLGGVEAQPLDLLLCFGHGIPRRLERPRRECRRGRLVFMRLGYPSRAGRYPHRRRQGPFCNQKW